MARMRLVRKQRRRRPADSPERAAQTAAATEGPGDMRFTAITANGQPAAALYMINRETGRHEEFQLHVLEVRPGGIAHVVAFHADGLFAKFGLPAAL